jgi:hypothetical protein
VDSTRRPGLAHVVKDTTSPDDTGEHDQADVAGQEPQDDVDRRAIDADCPICGGRLSRRPNRRGCLNCSWPQLPGGALPVNL